MSDAPINVELTFEEYQERLKWVHSIARYDQFEARLLGQRIHRTMDIIDIAAADYEIKEAIKNLEESGAKSPSGCAWQKYDVGYHRWFPTTFEVAQKVGATNYAHKNEQCEMGMYILDQQLFHERMNNLPLRSRAFGV